jgi:3-oxoacyl-[acyl-carrier protein] reductase
MTPSQPVPPVEPHRVPRFADLDGKVAVVTGGSSGIGAATALALAANGVRVAILDTDGEAAADLARTIGDWGGESLGVVCDVTSRAALEQAREAVERAYGAVDVLVPFAGGFRRYTPIHELDEDEWQAVLDLNLTATYRTIRTFVTGMMGRRRGAIVAMGSSSGRLLDEPVTAPYAAAKAGVVMLVRHLAIELGPFGIRVNSVNPATTRSERVDAIVPRARQDHLASLSPLGRMGYPSDVAYATLYLASDAAEWVTGVSLDVAGGRVMI